MSHPWNGRACEHVEQFGGGRDKKKKRRNRVKLCLEPPGRRGHVLSLGFREALYRSVPLKARGLGSGGVNR